MADDKTKPDRPLRLEDCPEVITSVRMLSELIGESQRTINNRMVARRLDLLPKELPRRGRTHKWDRLEVERFLGRIGSKRR